MALGIFIFLLGISGILFYDRYYVPIILSEEVVKVKAPEQGLVRNYSLTNEDLYIDKMPQQHLPDGYLKTVDEAVGRVLNVDLTDGTVLTSTMIDIDDLSPSEDEGIFSIPQDAIFAINGTLRRRDKVNVYLVSDPRSRSSETAPKYSEAFLENVPVAYVRSSNNNDVRDTEDGNTNHRITSTGQVSYPELIINFNQGERLKRKIEEGYLLWIVRVD